jgi:hypothetical protein
MITTKHIIAGIEDVPVSWVFETYCNLETKLDGGSIKIRSMFNPSDSVPSMVIFCKDDAYFFKDFSTDRGGTHVKLVMELYNLTYGQAINKIIDDYRLYIKSPNAVIPETGIREKPKFTLESYDTRQWIRGDAEYWLQYGICSDILELYNVKPLSSVTFSKNENGTYEFFTSQKPFVYGYFRTDGSIYKIYQPYVREKKFMQIANYIQGMDQLLFKQPYLIITSSLKDGLSLRKLKFPVEFIAPHSEGTLIREEVINSLKEKYKGVACLFDNDAAGLKAMDRYKEVYNLPSIHLPMEKDLSDSVKKHGQKAVKQALIPLINNTFNL